MINLPHGTNELLYVIVSDKFEQITTLDPFTKTYEVYNDNADRDATPDPATPVLTGPATNDDMVVAAGPINTAPLEIGEYSLFIILNLPPQTIKLGPFHFSVG